jgi:hypothetical protein
MGVKAVVYKFEKTDKADDSRKGQALSHRGLHLQNDPALFPRKKEAVGELPLAGSSRWQEGDRSAVPNLTRGWVHASSREAGDPFASAVGPSRGSGVLARLRGSRRSRPFSDPQPPEAA